MMRRSTTWHQHSYFVSSRDIREHFILNFGGKRCVEVVRYLMFETVCFMFRIMMIGGVVSINAVTAFDESSS